MLSKLRTSCHPQPSIFSFATGSHEVVQVDLELTSFKPPQHLGSQACHPKPCLFPVCFEVVDGVEGPWSEKMLSESMLFT